MGTVHRSALTKADADKEAARIAADQLQKMLENDCDVELLTDSQRAALEEIRLEFGVQPPDLLVFSRHPSRLWFAEVKGPGDRLRDIQKSSHAAIRRRLGLPVELIEVRLYTDRAGEQTGSR